MVELTQQQKYQKRFFEDFGYLCLPGLLSAEIDWITEEVPVVLGLIGPPALPIVAGRVEGRSSGIVVAP